MEQLAGRHWFSYVDRTVTTDLLEKLTAEFLHIFDKCPSRLKKKMMTMSNTTRRIRRTRGRSIHRSTGRRSTPWPTAMRSRNHSTKTPSTTTRWLCASYHPASTTTENRLQSLQRET
ncbi:unnamed protein product [Leptidea sinapis]|uniref:Uncharacterized protein n=1 Tax=Leptidea sinapis TaxID=189913 RepID=A0A5E4QVW7_9NEOP|nr:unnamed protein product [Leptidea sinapis]